MATTAFEPMLRNGLIRAIDNISKRAAETERAAEGAIGKLLNRWNEMEPVEKEHVAAIVIATATTAVTAFAAMRRGPAKTMKRVAKKAVVKAARKMT